MGFEPVTAFLLIIHVIFSVVWIGTLFALNVSFSTASAAGYERLESFLGASWKRLLGSSIVLGAMTIMLGITLAELLLGFESALDFGNTRVWPLHLGGALGLMSVLILIMGIAPSRSDIAALLWQFTQNKSSDVEPTLKSLVWRVRIMSIASLGLSLLAAGLMAFSRSVS